ncbi:MULTISPECIES: PH domain-containing protein [Aeromicrobium]|uniref:PH domain-containing protein n=1 Tax=Aeromicrobium TaxID=2040 RepID=UPI00257FA9FF|nr:MULTISPECIES: PH domain-containing protein [Aeromicrobium]
MGQSVSRRTFRPVGVIVVMWACVVVLAVLAALIGIRLPEEYKFTTSQTATIWVLIGFMALFALFVSRSHVTADDEGLTFVNGWRRRTLRWDGISVVSMRPGTPWPTVETKDGRRFALFAIQASEGDPARDAVTWLSGHVR